MSVWSTIASLQGPVVLLLVVFGPSVLPRVLAYWRQPRQARVPRPPLPRALKAVLALHTLYHIYQLAVPPYDVFLHSRLPVVAPVDRIRAALERAARPAAPASPTSLAATETSPLLDLLLSRFGSLDARLVYLRVGHDAFAGCVWCRTLDDFVVAALPGILAPYVALAVVLGTLGWKAVGGPDAGARARRWRGTFGGALVVLAALDVGARYLWDLRVVDGDCLHLSSTLTTLRSVALLALPILYVLLPVPTPISNAPLLSALSTALAATRLAALTRAATVHSAPLRRSWARNADVRAYAEAAARQDPAVRAALAGTGVEPARARENAAAYLDHEWAKVVALGQQKL